MEEGFPLGVTQRGYLQTTWVQGRPEPSFWMTLNLKGRTRRAVVAQRCSQCGYLESYAQTALPARAVVLWPFLAAALLFLLAGLLFAVWGASRVPRASRGRAASELQICRDRYAAARTADDSAAVDRSLVAAGPRQRL